MGLRAHSASYSFRVLAVLWSSPASATSSSALELLRCVRRVTLEKACESALKQGVLDVATRYIKGSLEINKATVLLCRIQKAPLHCFEGFGFGLFV
jgi:hypothetical protein